LYGNGDHFGARSLSPLDEPGHAHAPEVGLG